MAVLYITEYAYLGTVPMNGGQMPQEPPIAEQTITIGASSAQSNAFNTATKFVRLQNDGTSACAVEFGANPTATVAVPPAGSQRLAANQTEYHALPAGATFKVAVIATT